MANISKQVAVATAVVGYDLLKDEPENRSNMARTIQIVGLVGSAAVGDTEVELVVGNVKQGKYTNTTAGVSATNPGSVSMDKDAKKVDVYVPANAQVQMIVTDAPATNDVRVEVHFGRSSSGGGRFNRGRTTGRRTTRRSARRTPAGMY